jgi:hypothetical protein
VLSASFAWLYWTIGAIAAAGIIALATMLILRASRRNL